MAAKGTPRSLDRLHPYFETYPEWRHLIAVALADYARNDRRRPQDWRLLVRSLTVVEEEHARVVLKALVRFREKSTKPRWLRQVIVLGLKLGNHGAQDAISLLEHWSSRDAGDADEPWKTALGEWQQWFNENYPDQPAAVLPELPAKTKWQYEPLRKFLYSQHGWSGDVRRGRHVFEKAECHKCHRFGDRGERLGPDLSRIAGRLQKKEILQAVLFPSDFVPEEYVTQSVVTTDGRSFTGLVGRADDSSKLVILQTNGQKATIGKSEVDEMILNKLSAMPVGGLEQLTQQEIADLFTYLHQRPSR